MAFIQNFTDTVGHTLERSSVQFYHPLFISDISTLSPDGSLLLTNPAEFYITLNRLTADFILCSFPSATLPSNNTILIFSIFALSINILLMFRNFPFETTKARPALISSQSRHLKD